MPAKSKNQQQAAGMALAAKRGEMPKSELKGAAKSMYESMTKEELKDYAETDRKDLPEKKKEAMMKGFHSELQKNAVSLAGASGYAKSILKGIGKQFPRTARQFRGGSKLIGKKGFSEGGKQFLKSKGGQQAVKSLGTGAGLVGGGALAGSYIGGGRTRRRRY